MWIAATAVACIVIQLFGIVESLVVRGGLFIAAFWLVWKGSGLLKVRGVAFPFRFTFNTINSYAFVVMVLFTLDHLFH
jgi:hypothetical protein